MICFAKVADLNGESEAADSIPKTSTPLTTILPISLVKKIAFRDEEVGRISADGIRMIAESCGLFLGLLAAKSYKHAVTSKRKNFKFSDIEHVAKKDKRMCDMGLPMSFEIEEEFVLLRNKRNTESNTAKPKDATNRSGTKTKTLNSFFAPKPSADA
jgi:histone H3/H4